MAAQHKVSFDSIAWHNPAPGVRQKLVRDGDTLLRLVEFTREFIEQDWCTNGHVGYVLDGEADVDFDGTTVHFAPCDGVFIPEGADHRHKLHVTSGVFRLILVEHAHQALRAGAAS